MDANIDNDFAGEKYKSFLEKLDSPWEHKPKTDEELKQLVKDFYESKIFSNFHMSEQHMITQVFMPILFMGHLDWPDKTTRAGKLLFLFNEHKEIAYHERFNKWLADIGMIYEYYGVNTAPYNINGMPIFYSCNVLSINDNIRFWEFYKKYENLQKNIMENF